MKDRGERKRETERNKRKREQGKRIKGTLRIKEKKKRKIEKGRKEGKSEMRSATRKKKR